LIRGGRRRKETWTRGRPASGPPPLRSATDLVGAVFVASTSRHFAAPPEAAAPASRRDGSASVSDRCQPHPRRGSSHVVPVGSSPSSGAAGRVHTSASRRGSADSGRWRSTSGCLAPKSSIARTCPTRGVEAASLRVGSAGDRSCSLARPGNTAVGKFLGKTRAGDASRSPSRSTDIGAEARAVGGQTAPELIDERPRRRGRVRF